MAAGDVCVSGDEAYKGEVRDKWRWLEDGVLATWGGGELGSGKYGQGTGLEEQGGRVPGGSIGDVAEMNRGKAWDVIGRTRVEGVLEDGQVR